ncbi:MAG: F0F1 ATP synthase subunit B [Candidatus Sulfotelmatobacter sp.]
MHPLALLTMAAGPGGQIREIAFTFGVDWPHLMAQIVSFCIVCALLQRFAYKPVLKVLQDRRQQIAQGLADAQKMKADLAQTEMRHQEILMQANAQATQMIDEAHAAAARVQQQETQKAIAAAEQIIVTARETAEQEHARMLAELKRELGRLVVQTTATVTGKILTPEDQRRLAEEASRPLAV